MIRFAWVRYIFEHFSCHDEKLYQTRRETENVFAQIFMYKQTICSMVHTQNRHIQHPLCSGCEAPSVALLSLSHLFNHPRFEGRVEKRRGEPAEHPTHDEPSERGVQHQHRGARLQHQAGHAPNFVRDEATHDALEQDRERQLRGHAGEVHPDDELLRVYLTEGDEQVGRLKPLRQEGD